MSGAYLGSHWKNTTINGNDLPFAVSIEGLNLMKRYEQANNEAGSGSVIEINGREPVNFSINCHIIGSDEQDYKSQLDTLFKIFNPDSEISIENPVLERFSIRKIIITGISDFEEGDLTAEATIDCIEYSENLFETLNYATEEQEYADNVSDEDETNAENKKDEMNG